MSGTTLNFSIPLRIQSNTVSLEKPSMHDRRIGSHTDHHQYDDGTGEDDAASPHLLALQIKSGTLLSDQ
jgi:hypothetical protein